MLPEGEETRVLERAQRRLPCRRRKAAPPHSVPAQGRVQWWEEPTGFGVLASCWSPGTLVGHHPLSGAGGPLSSAGPARMCVGKGTALQAAGTRRDCSLSSTTLGSPWLPVLPTRVSLHSGPEGIASNGGKPTGARAVRQPQSILSSDDGPNEGCVLVGRRRGRMLGAGGQLGCRVAVEGA